MARPSDTEIDAFTVAMTSRKVECVGGPHRGWDNYYLQVTKRATLFLWLATWLLPGSVIAAGDYFFQNFRAQALREHGGEFGDLQCWYVDAHPWRRCRGLVVTLGYRKTILRGCWLKEKGNAQAD